MFYAPLVRKRTIVTLHRILATLVMARAQHVRTVRQKMQKLSRNDHVRILIIKNLISFVLDNTVETIAFLLVNISTDTLPTTCLSRQLRHAYRVNSKMRTESIIQHAYRVST